MGELLKLLMLALAGTAVVIAIASSGDECGVTNGELQDAEKRYQACIGGIKNSLSSQALCRRLTYGTIK